MVVLMLLLLIYQLDVYKRQVIMIGTKSSVARAVKTVNGEERYTLFKERLQGRCDG